MYLVGTLVLVDPVAFELVIPEIKSFCDVDIVHEKPQSGSLMIELTCTSLTRCKRLINKIGSLPFVSFVEIIYFYHSVDMEIESGGNDDETEFEVNDTQVNTQQTSFEYGSLVHTRH